MGCFWKVRIHLGFRPFRVRVNVVHSLHPICLSRYDCLRTTSNWCFLLREFTSIQFSITKQGSSMTPSHALSLEPPFLHLPRPSWLPKNIYQGMYVLFLLLMPSILSFFALNRCFRSTSECEPIPTPVTYPSPHWWCGIALYQYEMKKRERDEDWRHWSRWDHESVGDVQGVYQNESPIDSFCKSVLPIC